MIRRALVAWFSCSTFGFAGRLAALLLVVWAAASSATAQSASGFAYNGIVYTSYQANEYLETPQGPTSAAALRATGANYASVVVTQYVQASTSNTIAPETATTPGYNSSIDPLTPTDAAVVAAIQNLQAQGLTVFLKPHVDSLDGTYRGNLAPTDVAAWFASYQTFLLHYAQLASQNGVGGLVIGTELGSLSNSSYFLYWKDLIAQLRAQYPSLTLAYGANATYATDEFATVSFWSLVDLIGVDGYFPLTSQADPTVAELVAAWTDNQSGLNIVQALKNLQSTYNKPLIFTELRYVSAAGTNEAPFDSAAAGAAYDATEQENCYEAFFEVFSQQTAWMKGVFWWDWTVSPPAAADTGYSPQTKPAGMVTLPKWYGAGTPGFTIAASNQNLQVGQGLNAADTIAVTYQGGFTGAVSLAVAGLPAGVTAAVTPGSVAGTQILTFSASSGATNGVTAVTVTGSSGAITATAAIALNVEAATAQTISFLNPGPQTVGVSSTLAATASSGLPVVFTSSTTSVCTVSGTATSFVTSGSCTITAAQGGNSVYAQASPVSQSFLVSFVPATPVPAADEILVSQVNWLEALGGSAITSDNPAGGNLAVNSLGEVVAGTGSALALFNTQTGAETALGTWNGAGAAAVDSSNNIYLGNYYAGAPIVKLPYVGGSANGGYAPFTIPGASTPACTSASSDECTIAAAGGVNVGALTLDTAGDLFYATAYTGSGENAIYECTVACLGGTASPVLIYQEPAAATPASASSGQLVVGAIAVDPMGNLFFTDSLVYVNETNYQFTSFGSNLKELPKTSGGVDSGGVLGYALQPAVLYAETPSSIAPYNNEEDAVVVSQATGTVYFADQSSGLLAFPNSGATIPLANGQPTALYTISTQGAKALALDSTGNFSFVASSNAITAGADTVGRITLNSVSVPSSPAGVVVSPSATLNSVTTILNSGSCASNPQPSITFAGGASATAAATLSANSTCTSTVSGAAALATNVSFTPSVLGADSVTVTGTDELSNSLAVVVSGVGLAPLTAQTITFGNPGAQSQGTPLTLVASASSGLAVTFTSATLNVCTVSGATATFVAAGTCTIDANQPGNTTYAAASQVQQSFSVSPAPSYTLVSTSGTLSVTQGAAATDTITIVPANGFTGGVTLMAMGVPSGVTVSFGTNPANGASGITFTAAGTATPGSSTVTIAGISGSLSASTTIVLTVNAAPSFTIAPAAGAIALVQGASATDTVNLNAVNGFTGSVSLTATGLPTGVTASFATNPATASSVLTFTASSAARAGTATVTITGSSGPLTASTTIALTVAASPSFTLMPVAAAVSLSQGGTATDTIDISAANGFTGSVTLVASGLPSGVSASFGTNPATASTVLTLTASSAAAPGTANVTITGTSGALAASTTLSVTVSAPAGILVTPASVTVSLNPGASGSDAITVAGTDGFSGSVSLSAAIAASPQGAQDLPTLSFGSTSPVTVTPTASGVATLSIGTTAATSGAVQYPLWRGLAGSAVLAWLVMLPLSSKRRRWPRMLALAALLCTLGTIAGCGGGSNGGGTGGSGGTTAGNYTVTITATSGTIVQRTTVMIAVQ